MGQVRREKSEAETYKKDSGSLMHSFAGTDLVIFTWTKTAEVRGQQARTLQMTRGASGRVRRSFI